MLDESCSIEIYSSRSCGYCHAARALLDTRGYDYVDIDITFDEKRREEMIERSGRRSVPQIFVDSKPIGGYGDLLQLLNG